MEEHESVITTCEGEQPVIAAAQYILKELAASKNVTEDLRKTLSDCEIHLSEMSRVHESTKELKRQLKCAENKVMSWEANHSPKESCEYIEVVDEIQTLTQSLQSLSMNENLKQTLLQRANRILHITMLRLEEELVHILVQHKQYFEPEYISFHSNTVDMVYDELFVSVEEGQIEKASQSSDGSQSKACTVHLVHPDRLPDLESIANVMFASKYHNELCQALITSRRDALQEYFAILEVENLSFEDVQKMKWQCLNFEIRKWIRAMKIIVQVYLPSEKRLCKQILGNFGTVYQFCFSEISKSFMLQLLIFGEAIAMGTHTTEKLFCLLDMYGVLEYLAVDVDFLFLEEVGSFVRDEFHKLLRRFGDSVRSTFLAFRNATATDSSTNSFPRGGVHQLTKHVMNYIKTLAEYGDTLNLLLADESPADLAGNEHDTSALTLCPMACHFRSITATLESNLSNKSRLYRDVALQHIFMMNNIHYMVQKVKSSELSLFFGDDWLRQHIGKFQHDARSYERVTWGSVLSLLRGDSGSHCVSGASLKKRLAGFSSAFDEVYRVQTGWCIPDPELRADLQISISQKVVYAYWTFTGRNSSSIGDKWIKYTVDDLESYILELFEGSSRSLRYRQLTKGRV